MVAGDTGRSGQPVQQHVGEVLGTEYDSVTVHRLLTVDMIATETHIRLTAIVIIIIVLPDQVSIGYTISPKTLTSYYWIYQYFNVTTKRL